MKIKLPNNADFTNDVIGFLEQLELSVHHAKKSAEKILEKYSKEDIANSNGPYIVYRFPLMDYDKYSEVVDNCLDQDIDIEINEI